MLIRYFIVILVAIFLLPSFLVLLKRKLSSAPKKKPKSGLKEHQEKPYLSKPKVIYSRDNPRAKLRWLFTILFILTSLIALIIVLDVIIRGPEGLGIESVLEGLGVAGILVFLLALLGFLAFFPWPDKAIIKISKDKLLINGFGGLLTLGLYIYELKKIRYIGYRGEISSLKLIFVSNTGDIEFSVSIPVKKEKSSQLLNKISSASQRPILPEREIVSKVKQDYQNILKDKGELGLNPVKLPYRFHESPNDSYGVGLFLLVLILMFSLVPNKTRSGWIWTGISFFLALTAMFIANLNPFRTFVILKPDSVYYHKWPRYQRKTILFRDIKKISVFYNPFSYGSKIGTKKAVGGLGAHQLDLKTKRGKSISLPTKLEEMKQPYIFLTTLVQAIKSN